MCGIAGLLNFDGQQPSEDLIDNMISIIHHRGPDDGKLWIGDCVGLGFRRLSIIDVAEGSQPLSNEDDSIWIIFNGEIYNYLDLRNDLLQRGHLFKTRTDTEVIVHLYEEHGENCVEYLRGMFCFAIWDRRKKQLFLARDHFGIKPLYYYYDHSMLAFGSEIKSILTVPGLPRKLNMNSLYNYLTFQYVPDPDTMYEGVQKLPPAHTMTIPFQGNPQLRKYWDPMFEPVDRPLAQLLEEIRDVLTDSVQHHIYSDHGVQRGCFLSSGIDSTITSTLMRSMEPMKTFSVGFEGVNNETIIARETANQIYTEHYDRMITEDMFFDAVPQAIWHLDEPVADPAAIALYELARLAREHVTVVLSGEGADELFGGYRIYREPNALRFLSWMSDGTQRVINQMLKKIPYQFYGKNYILRGTTPLALRFLGNANIFTDDVKPDLLRVTVEQILSYSKPFDKAKQYYDRTPHLGPVTRMQYIDMNLWLPGDILMKADKLTMAHSLELRVPFIDRKVFDVASRIPMKYLIADGTTKYALRKAMQGIIPDSIINRPKLGFPVPLRDWMRTQRSDLMWEHISGSGIESIINLNTVEKMFRLHKDGYGDYSRKLWVLYVFAQWHAAYM